MVVKPGNIVRGETGAVKSPAWAVGLPSLKTVLTAIICLVSGGPHPSQIHVHGTGVKTSVAFAVGCPLEKTVQGVGITVLGKYMQHPLKEMLSGNVCAATCLAIVILEVYKAKTVQ